MLGEEGGGFIVMWGLLDEAGHLMVLHAPGGSCGGCPWHRVALTLQPFLCSILWLR